MLNCLITSSLDKLNSSTFLGKLSIIGKLPVVLPGIPKIDEFNSVLSSKFFLFSPRYLLRIEISSGLVYESQPMDPGILLLLEILLFNSFITYSLFRLYYSTYIHKIHPQLLSNLVS